MIRVIFLYFLDCKYKGSFISIMVYNGIKFKIFLIIKYKNKFQYVYVTECYSNVFRNN